jgi:uncharacterized membrane protein
VIGAEWIYWLGGAFFFAAGAHIALERNHPKRWTSAAFWMLLGLALCYGSFVPRLPAAPLGAAAIALALLGGLGLTGRGTVSTTTDRERTESALRLGNKLFLPVLAIPVVTISLASRIGTLPALSAGVITALVVALILLRPRKPAVALREGRRLLEAIGWAALLPQMLAVLGLLFTKAGVGTQVGAIAHTVVPDHARVVAVIVYALGMAVFTIIMGNAFAAFPIMTAAIGWPVLVEQMGAHPAPLFAIGMLSGFCGTLCTPMAAIFNLVPPALLEMKDKYGQIKVQIPTAIALLAVNIVFMLVFPFL